VILVNDRPAVALKSAEQAQQVLDAVLAPYQSAPANRQRTEVAFVENVRVEQQPIDYSLVMSLDDAVRALALGSAVEDNYCTVEKGDSLARIAKRFGIKVSDLRKANPTLSVNDVLQPGDMLNAVKPANWVNVRYTETVTRQEALPFNTVEQTDATLYTTQKQTKQEGKNGKREVVAKVTYINGMEASKVIESQTVLEAAQDRIVLRGTKKVPTSSGGGSSASGSYIKPLKSYRVTSRYGPRSLHGRSYHYGYDLAAPTGTPIYATASGTVSFSGSATGYGLVVYLDHAGGVQSRYGHCSKLLVKKGQKVTKGQIIALVGSTGQSTGPHLHFEFRLNGGHISPTKYVKLE
jgi:murein DD-endopeptidase MepM/ murein hydrolase activator NlpD